MIRCTFPRIGRSKDLSVDIPLDDPYSPRFLPEVCRFAAKHLRSSDPSLYIYADAGDRSGTIVIDGGRFGEGTWQLLDETPAVETPAPLTNWGSDHWSTFAYIETRCVDHDGWLADAHLRGHLGRRPAQYPTRLKQGEIPGHDDYDCIDDIEAAGLVTVDRARETRNSIRGQLTPAGSTVAAQLRQHKANGGNWRNFAPDLAGAR